MPVSLAGSHPEPSEPRVLVLREFADLSPVLALVNTAQPVLAGLRMAESDRQRALDTLAGWSVGSGGDVDVISHNTVVIRPAWGPPVRLSRPGVVSAVGGAFSGPAHPLTMGEGGR